MELLKQGAQRERRPERAVRHDWYRVTARAVDLPVHLMVLTERPVREA